LTKLKKLIYDFLELSKEMMMKVPGIIQLPPNRVWRTYLGGKTLDILEKKEDPSDNHYPEDWIASTTKANNKGRENCVGEGLSRIEQEGQEIFLKDLFAEFPEETLGAKHTHKYGANTQFLVKFLDSAVRLHIQCHPTAEFAKRYLNSPSGKTEAYVILKTREEVKNPYVYLGFQHLPSKEEFKNAIVQQNLDRILSCFEKIPVRPGEVFIVPGGLPHAIGEGVFMVEIMEPTDFVVRIEFERGGYVLPEEARFMERGVDFGLSMFQFDQRSVEEVRKQNFIQPKVIHRYNDSSNEYSLMDEQVSRCFRVKKICLAGRLIKKEESFYIGIVTQGAGTISTHDLTYEVRTGDKFFVPFQTDRVQIESQEGMEILIALPPE
jgi:mannose-6-phosphate isomerase